MFQYLQFRVDIISKLDGGYSAVNCRLAKTVRRPSTATPNLKKMEIFGAVGVVEPAPMVSGEYGDIGFVDFVAVEGDLFILSFYLIM